MDNKRSTPGDEFRSGDGIPRESTLGYMGGLYRGELTN